MKNCELKNRRNKQNFYRDSKTTALVKKAPPGKGDSNSNLTYKNV